MTVSVVQSNGVNTGTLSLPAAASVNNYIVIFIASGVGSSLPSVPAAFPQLKIQNSANGVSMAVYGGIATSGNTNPSINLGTLSVYTGAIYEVAGSNYVLSDAGNPNYSGGAYSFSTLTIGASGIRLFANQVAGGSSVSSPIPTGTVNDYSLGNSNSNLSSFHTPLLSSGSTTTLGYTGSNPQNDNAYASITLLGPPYSISAQEYQSDAQILGYNLNNRGMVEQSNAQVLGFTHNSAQVEQANLQILCCGAVPYSYYVWAQQVNNPGVLAVTYFTAEPT